MTRFFNANGFLRSIGAKIIRLNELGDVRVHMDSYAEQFLRVHPWARQFVGDPSLASLFPQISTGRLKAACGRRLRSPEYKQRIDFFYLFFF